MAIKRIKNMQKQTFSNKFFLFEDNSNRIEEKKKMSSNLKTN